MVRQALKSAKRYPATAFAIRPLFARLICLMVAVMFLLPMDTMAEPEKHIFRVGFSRDIFADVNENDAMAAIKVWAMMIAKEQDILTDPTPRVYNGVQEIEQALKENQVDCLTLTVKEFAKLSHLLDDEVFLAGSNGKNVTEEYLVLTHRDSDIQRIGDLNGRRLCIFQSPRMILAPAWLDTVLLESKRPCAAEFCRVTSSTKLTKALLPVFFRQTDACVVSRSSFETMCELNPQLKQHLKVIASSPEFVPSGFTFRRNYNDDIRKMILTEFTNFLSSPSGAQFLTLFQLNQVEVKSPSCLDSSLKLIAKHKRLLEEDRQQPGQSH